MTVHGYAKVILFILLCIVICVFTVKYDKVESISAKTFENSIGMEMVFISKGYLVSRYEVTQGQFEKIMDYNPSYYRYKGKDHPVVNLTGLEAEEFCIKLTEYESIKDTLLEGYVYALPSFDEWMQYVADASIEGSVTPAGFSHGTPQSPMPVGSGEINRLKLFDLRGNVSEYSRDKFEGKNYILGGAWDEKRKLRLTIKNKGNFSGRNDSSPSVGFRCVLVKTETCL